MKEKRWLAAAYHRSWAGVEQVIFHRLSTAPNDLEDLNAKLQAKLAARALDFVLELDSSGTAVTEADLNRFLAARSTQPQKVEAAASTKVSPMEWIRAFHGDTQERALANPNNRHHQMFKDLNANSAACLAAAPKRMRTRFAEV